MDPALWGFCGVAVTGLVAILIELIRNSRKTHDVLVSVEELKQDVGSATRRIDEHINWHLTRETFVYVRPKGDKK